LSVGVASDPKAKPLPPAPCLAARRPGIGAAQRTWTGG
jgi:hypothetical protein